MTTLMSYLAGFGLATGVGAKAFIPVLILGGFHHMPYFELSPRWSWIADPLVMGILAVLVVAEIMVDSVPELAEYADLVSYLPKFVVGFIAFAAVTGSVDQNLVELTGSGLLGSTTATGVHFVRTKVRRPWRDTFETVHSSFGRVASVSEAGVSASLSGASVLAPPVAFVFAGVGAFAAWGIWRFAGSRSPACPQCGGTVHRDALVCPHCRAELTPFESPT